MKNQYFGDLNDYYKYGLLRILQSEGAHKLLVAWMLTPDDGSKDGKHHTYLTYPERWRPCDPELFVGIDTDYRRRRKMVGPRTRVYQCPRRRIDRILAAIAA